MDHKKKHRRRFTLVELMFAALIFALMVLGCAAAFPTALKAGHTGNNYAQAALTTQHKIDQCREQGCSAIYPSSAPAFFSASEARQGCRK